MGNIHQLTVNGITFEYYLVIEKRKSTSLKIIDQKLVVYTNAYTPIEQIEAFILKKLSILSKIASNKNKQYHGSDDGVFCYLDKAYPIIYQKSEKERVEIIQNELCVFYKKENNIDKLIKKFMMKSLEKLIPQLLNKYQNILLDYHLQVPEFKYKFLKSRWGSCAYQRGEITLNAYLIHYDIAFVEAVFIHELAHLVVPNHSKRFYQVVSNYEKDYQKKIKLVN